MNYLETIDKVWVGKIPLYNELALSLCNRNVLLFVDDFDTDSLVTTPGWVYRTER